jgi:hypothetical protein
VKLEGVMGGAALGYRHLVLDFNKDRVDLKVTMTGPFLAVDFTW